MAGRFQLMDSDESEYSEEESDEKQRIEDRRQLFDDSSDDEEEKRVVKTQKEKRWAALQEHCTKIKNKLKIQDYFSTVNEYEELMKQIAKSENVIQAEGVPVFCIRTFVRLEDAVNAISKESQKKMNTNNAKAFTKLKINLKKNKAQYEEKISQFRANPVESASESESEEQSEEEVKVQKKDAGKPVKKQEDDENEEEEEDSDEWGEGSDDESESDSDKSEEEKSRPVDPQERRRFWELKPEKKNKEKIDKPDKPSRPDKQDEKKLKEKQESKEVKKEVYTSESISAKLREIIEKRTKKVTNLEVFISELKVLLNNCKDVELTLQIINLIVLFELENAKDTITVIMPRSTWLSIVDYLNKILDLYSPKSPSSSLDDTRKTINLSLALRVDRLSSELTKALKTLDPKSLEYRLRLRDNLALSKLVSRVHSFYSSIQDYSKLSLICLLGIYQIHYIHDDTLAAMKSNSQLPPSNDYFFSVSDSQKYIEDLANIVYTHGENNDKVFAALMVAFHHALHSRYDQAKSLFLKTNPSSVQGDPNIQVYINRAIVQIGLAAFYNGDIESTFASLNEIVSTHRLKELLAQTVSLNKEKQAVYEERKRAVPYHMHINTDVVETVYFISAMLLDIPKIAMNPGEPEKYTVSRYFKKLMDFHERQASSGLTESFREYITIATQKLRRGYWEEAYGVIESLETWKHVPRKEKVKELLVENLKKAGMVTFLLTYGNLYENFSKEQLSQKFGIQKEKIVRIINPLILSSEIEAYWEGEFLNLKVQSVAKSEADRKEKTVNLEGNEILSEFAQYMDKPGEGLKAAGSRKKKVLRKNN